VLDVLSTGAWGDLLEAAIADGDDLVGEMLCCFQVMGDHQDCLTQFPAERRSMASTASEFSVSRLPVGSSARMMPVWDPGRAIADSLLLGRRRVTGTMLKRP